MSLRSSNQQPTDLVCHMRSALAVNRTRHVGYVTCARYHKVMSSGKNAMEMFCYCYLLTQYLIEVRVESQMFLVLPG